MRAIELNDAGLAVHSEERTLAESAGHALIGDGELLLGAAAAARARVQPMLAHDRFWDELSLEALPRPAGRMHNHADATYHVFTLLTGQLTDLHVLRVEPATLRAPGDAEQGLVGDPALYAPLALLLWEMAMRGAREALLPEIAGQAAYRISPALNLRILGLGGSMADAVARLKRDTTNLRSLSQWPGFDRERAMRLLNGLYLQGGLMVSRTHPAATNEGWSTSRH